MDEPVLALVEGRFHYAEEFNLSTEADTQTLHDGAGNSVTVQKYKLITVSFTTGRPPNLIGLVNCPAYFFTKQQEIKLTGIQSHDSAKVGEPWRDGEIREIELVAKEVKTSPR